MNCIRKEFVIKNDVRELNAFAGELLSFCRDNAVTDDTAHEILLAVEEAVSNVIKYGYDDQHVHTIRVAAEAEEHEVVVEIVDDGKEFNPLQAPAPDLTLPIEQRPVGGLGIYLMRSVMDTVEYRRDGDKNLLTMTKKL